MFLVEAKEVFLNVRGVGIVAAPVWVRVERECVGVRRNVAGTAWIAVLVPSVTI